MDDYTRRSDTAVPTLMSMSMAVPLYPFCWFGADRTAPKTRLATHKKLGDTLTRRSSLYRGEHDRKLTPHHHPSALQSCLSLCLPLISRRPYLGVAICAWKKTRIPQQIMISRSEVLCWMMTLRSHRRPRMRMEIGMSTRTLSELGQAGGVGGGGSWRF